jgi:Tetracyclin repressor-like, C-terminal domain
MANEVRGPLPIKVDSTSNGEFRPVPLIEPVARANREAERRIGEHAHRVGLGRRAFLQSLCGAASTLLTFNEAFAALSNTGGFFRVPKEGAFEAAAATLFLEILSYHKDNLLIEKRVHDMVLVAIEQNWNAILAHKETMRTAVELILRDGIEAGEFERVDPRETSHFFMQSLVGFCHPVLVAQSLQDGHDLESEARDSVRFLLRAITPRR